MPGDCIVTGGAGFIGCALSALLADRFARVVAVDNVHPQVHGTKGRPAALDTRVALLEGDITEAATWQRVLTSYRPEVVVHLAAETGTAQSLTEASRHGLVNVVGTTRMLDAFAASGIVPRRVLLASSRAVYGEGRWHDAAGNSVYPGQRSAAMLARGEWDFPGLEPQPFEATSTDARPTSIYGTTKLAQEHLLSAWCLAMGTEPIILRLQNVMGPGQSLINAYTGIVVLFCRLAREGKTIPLYEDGRITRDFVDVVDVVDAMIAALDRRADAPDLPSPLDIGSGETRTIAELAHSIATRYGAPEPVVNGAYRQGDVRHAACDISRARTALGWAPKRPFDETLEAVCRYTDEIAAGSAS